MVVQSQTKFDDFIFYMKRIETAPNIITSKTTSKCIRHFYSCVKISVIISLIKICFDIENHIFRKFESLPFKTHTYVILFVFHLAVHLHHPSIHFPPYFATTFYAQLIIILFVFGNHFCIYSVCFVWFVPWYRRCSWIIQS